nr:hypothetical protein CFP56_28583 [Quercus suber]
MEVSIINGGHPSQAASQNGVNSLYRVSLLSYAVALLLMRIPCHQDQSEHTNPSCSHSAGIGPRSIDDLIRIVGKGPESNGSRWVEAGAVLMQWIDVESPDHNGSEPSITGAKSGFMTIWLIIPCIHD